MEPRATENTEQQTDRTDLRPTGVESVKTRFYCRLAGADPPKSLLQTARRSSESLQGRQEAAGGRKKKVFFS